MRLLRRYAPRNDTEMGLPREYARNDTEMGLLREYARNDMLT